MKINRYLVIMGGLMAGMLTSCTDPVNPGIPGETSEIAFHNKWIEAPNQEEIKMLELVNELRTQGTLMNESSYRAGTCAESWKPLPPLKASGVLSEAARSHAAYLAEIGFEGHQESHTESPNFTGRTAADRMNNAYKRMGGTRISAGAENVGLGQVTAFEITLQWLRSKGHCEAMMDPKMAYMGAGYRTTTDLSRRDPAFEYPDPQYPYPGRGWVQVFQEEQN